MAIKLGGNTNITLTNTSFSVNSSDKIAVPLFTATSNGTYHFEGDLQDSGVMSTSLNINSTPKQIWTYYDTVSHHVSYEFTLVTGDVVGMETTGHGAGSNLTVTRYADEIKGIYVGGGAVRKVYVGTTKVRGTSAEFTDWDSDVVDYVAGVFDNTTDTADAIGYMFGSDFVATIQYDLGISLADWAYDAIYIGAGNSRYGLQISDGGDMTDMHLQSETSGRHSSICIVRDNDDLSDVEYIVGTYDGNDGFDYQLSSLASHFSGKDTVCMFIFLE